MGMGSEVCNRRIGSEKNIFTLLRAKPQKITQITKRLGCFAVCYSSCHSCYRMLQELRCQAAAPLGLLLVAVPSLCSAKLLLAHSCHSLRLVFFFSFSVVVVFCLCVCISCFVDFLGFPDSWISRFPYFQMRG